MNSCIMFSVPFRDLGVKLSDRFNSYFTCVITISLNIHYVDLHLVTVFFVAINDFVGMAFCPVQSVEMRVELGSFNFFSVFFCYQVIHICRALPGLGG